MPLENSMLVADLPCGATVSIRNDGLMDSGAQHSALMAKVEAHNVSCAPCRAFPPGAGGVVISRRP
jgi:hypothetical protein